MPCGQIDEPRGQAGFQDRRHQQVGADHELVVDVECVFIVLVVEQQRPEQRHAGAMGLLQRRVEERQQAIAQLQILADDVFVIRAEAPGLVIVASRSRRGCGRRASESRPRTSAPAVPASVRPTKPPTSEPTKGSPERPSVMNIGRLSARASQVLRVVAGPHRGSSAGCRRKPARVIT